MRALLPAAALLLLLLAGAGPAVRANEGPFVLFATTDGREYRPGEVAKICIHAFARGEPAVPDAPPKVYVVGGAGSGHEVPVEADSPSSWTASYTVLAADALIYDSRSIELEIRAFFRESGGGGQPYSTGADLRLAGPKPFSSPGPLSISAYVLECPDGAIRPGSKVTFLACATYNGMPVQAGDIRFHVAFRPDNGPDERVDLPAQERGPGTFAVPYTIPRKDRSGLFRLQADCLGVTKDHLESVPLDFFDVIYHEIARNGTAIEYELLVSDRAGKPENGTAVAVTTSSYLREVRPVTLDLGRTARDGRVRGVADLGPGVPEFYLRGWANTSDRFQYFGGLVSVPNATSPGNRLGSRFQIDRLSPSGALEAGGERTVSYRAYFDGSPLRRQELACYVRWYPGTSRDAATGDVSGRRVVTGEDGAFGLVLDLPENASGSTTVTVVGPGPPHSSDYSAPEDMLTVGVPAAPAYPAETWARATFSAARAGRALKVCASAPEGGIAAAWASWDFADDRPDGVRPWMALNTFKWFVPPRPAGGPLKGQLVLPSHLGVGQNITVSLQVLNASGQWTAASYELTVRPAPVPEPPADICCITAILLSNVLLFTFVFFNYVSGRRAERRRELGALDADGQITAVLRAQGQPARELALPLRVQLPRSEECAACARKVARGNAAWRCACGGTFHEHCAAGKGSCPSCGRPWRSS